MVAARFDKVWQLLVVFIVGFKAINASHDMQMGLNVQQPEDTSTFQPSVKVPVTLGVMSRCPDALLCESVFDKVLKTAGDKADVALSFIGTYVSCTNVSGCH